ncbi:restriction endonuclease subunit S [Desulfovibrio aerotolerans]|uniref:Restriction endonuclease subunit S n=1 Tax=Solidesulfovibrio aerotolerans TaxID=295255 RepID=A0A7C9ITN4_9BACT|nr:restriction endonuclease subunit S [Solidesulfovibrio aerotolerans]MYL81563.1 restriction endonuclease subunit S [Solidesulfovibrio aerotolerans]
MNSKLYRQHKDSGITWLPTIPSEWQSERAKNLFSESNLPVREEDEIVTCFRDGQVTLRKNRRERGFMNALLEGGYQGVRVNQLVVHAMDAFAGAVGVSDSNGKCTPEYVILNAKHPTINLQYYALLIREMARLDFIRIICPAVRERAPRLRYPNLARMFFPLPSKEEQDDIVQYVNSWKKKINCFIRRKRRLIALLKEQRQNIINKAITRGINPDVTLKPSGVPWLGDIPEHWPVMKLKRLVSMKSGDGITSLSISERGAYPVYGGNGHRGFSSSYTHDGDFILVGRQGALCGNVHLVNGRFWASEHAIVTTLNGNDDIRWLSELLRVMNLNQYSESAAQPGISVEKIMNLQIPAPPLNEQSDIASYFCNESKNIDIAISKTMREVELMREYRARLISDVVTGKVDVRNIELAPVPEEELLAIEDDVESIDDAEQDDIPETEE